MNESDFQNLEIQVKPTKLTCVPWDMAVKKSIERYVDMKENGAKPGVFTGYEEFDQDTGGLRRGALTVITAETGGCKSTFAANIMNHVCIRKRKPVAVFSFEMLQDEFVDISYSINAKIDRNLFNTGRFSDEDLKRMSGVTENMSQAPLYIFDHPACIEDIEEACLQLNAGVPLELVVVDYMQIVTPSSGMQGNREQQVAHISRSLSAMANKLRCPVVALSQLNEDGQVRESRAIAHDARLVLKLERNEYDTLIAKIQKGSRVLKKDYRLNFNVNFCEIV